MSDTEKPSAAPQKSMSDAERIELADKLDRDLDDFISGLQPSRYKHGWNEETWQQEMQEHPFFRSKAFEDGEELPPLIKGLQDIKYDKELNSEEDLAAVHKDDGNTYFRAKKYRMAVECYTEGLKLRNHSNTQLLTQLLTNRAAAHFHLANLRSCRVDCERALTLSPDHEKALRRAVECCRRLKMHQPALTYCDRLLQLLQPSAAGVEQSAIERDRRELMQLRASIEKERSEVDKQRRREARVQRSKELAHAALMDALCERRVKFILSDDIDKSAPVSGEALRSRPELLRVDVAGGVSEALPGVHLSTDHVSLVWPLLLLYPQHAQMDMVQQAGENDLVSAHVAEVLSLENPAPDWDQLRQYTVESVSLFYETWRGQQRCGFVKIEDDLTVVGLLSRSDFVVVSGVPRIFVLLKHGTFRQQFLSQYTQQMQCDQIRQT